MLIISLLIGIVAGLRAVTPLAAISWAARFGILRVGGTWLSFLGMSWSPWIFSLLALAEIVNDKLPQTPSRKVPSQFATRVIAGAFSGLAVALPVGMAFAGLLMGALGAWIGTLAASAVRIRLVSAIGGKDLPIALLEDCVAVGTAVTLISVLG